MRSNPAIMKLGKMQMGENAVAATYKGIMGKTIYFALATLIPAIIAFMLTFNTAAQGVLIALVTVAPIIAIISCIIGAMAPKTLPVTGSLYTIFQGLALGFISAIVGAEYGGIVFMALICTVVTLVAMSILYATGIIRVGSFFRKFMINALIAICISQLLIFLLSLFSSTISNAFYGNSVLSLIISIGMTIFASLMLLLDFSNITMIVENGMDKSYEWFGAFGLVTTLIWMYIQFLRLFMILMDRKG